MKSFILFLHGVALFSFSMFFIFKEKHFIHDKICTFLCGVTPQEFLIKQKMTDRTFVLASECVCKKARKGENGGRKYNFLFLSTIGQVICRNFKLNIY